MTDPVSRRYDITVTVTRDGGTLPGPAAFAAVARQAAAASGASDIVSAHSAEEIIIVVTVQASDRAAAVAIALAVVSEALRRPVTPSGH